MTLAELRELIAKQKNPETAASITPDEINAIAQLGENAADLTDEQLVELQDVIRETAHEQGKLSPSPTTVAILRQVGKVREAVAGQITARATAAEEIAAEMADLLKGFETPEPAEPQADATETGEQADEAPADAPVDAPADAEPAREPALAASGRIDAATVKALAQAMKLAFTAPDAVVASAADRPQGRTGRPGTTATPTGAPREVAQAKVYLGSNASSGREIDSDLALAQAVHDKWRGAYQAASFSGRMPVVHVDTAYPDSRILGNDSSVNFEKIRAATNPQSLVAAGGLCAPLETMYDVEVIGSAARPVKNALAGFQVERGGITYRPNSSAASVLANGTGIWTVEDDAAVPLGEKACYEVECPDMTEAVVRAVYLCLEFSNITARFDPETTASNVQEGMIAHARAAENALLADIKAGSKLLTGREQSVGAVRHILGELDRAVAYYRNRHRIDTTMPLTWIAPAWFMAQARADLAYQMAAGDWQDALGVADSQILAWFSRRSVAPVWHLDGTTDPETVGTVTIPQQTYDDAAAGAVIPDFPGSIDSLLFTSGSWLFLDGGSLDLGLVRDSTLNARNRYRQFSETFEGVADRGVESLRLNIECEATGYSAGVTEMVTDGAAV